MNIREIIFPLSLALLTTWGIHHFFFNSSANQDSQEVKSGQVFIAPTSKQELKPLNTEIDFLDEARKKPAQLSEIETKYARLVFSTDGASLEKLEFKHVANCPACPISTLMVSSELEKENRSLLLALEEKTPFYYELIERKDMLDAVVLVYQANSSYGTIGKKFTVYKETYKVDLEVSFDPSTQDYALEPRIFWSSPDVAAIAKTDVVSGIISNEKGSIEKIARANLSEGQGWFAPTLFGTDDRYFVHAMVDDAQGFIKRAYYKFSSKSKITSIVEGPVIQGQNGAQKFKLSFYMGPKEAAAMSAVDFRLEDTLEYAGFFAPISKFLLYVLKILYGYVKNFGFAIILLTILVKLFLFPFTYGAEDSMKKRLEFDKKLRYLQQKYKDQPEILAHERTELIKKHGMPGLSGCLPLLLQLPIFIALSRVLSSAIELYNAPFIGWIQDLSAKDPYYILPLITALAMIAQSLVMPSGDAKQRISTFVMALIIGAVTANLAAGLALYICTFTILGFVQTQVVRVFKRS
jgi:YidC/Oxa1 family membrane protein insertase